VSFTIGLFHPGSGGKWAKFRMGKEPGLPTARTQPQLFQLIFKLWRIKHEEAYFVGMFIKR
jgi:hypothetical protein